MSTAELYVETLLGRSKGSTLDIIVAHGPVTIDHIRTETLALLSPHAQRIGSLEFVDSYWSDIQESSKVISGPLPLLQTLKINASHGPLRHCPGMVTPPPLPLFAGAVNLKQFHLCSKGLPFLDCFVFPNLTNLEFSAMPAGGSFYTLRLLDFLEASPTLRTVRLRIEEDVFVPPGRVVVLPRVKMFDLSMREDGQGCIIAAHISCPSARLTSLLYEQDADSIMSPRIFPASATWSAIACQYTANPVEEVVFEITTARDPIITCFLTFLSPDPAVLALGFKVTTPYLDEDFDMTLGERHAEIFLQASTTIRTHPRLANVKRLRIQDRYGTIDSHELTRIASEVEQLFKSVGSLDTLTLDVFDLRPYLAPFLDFLEFCDIDQPGRFPPVKELTIAQPSQAPAKQECMATVVKLAKSQHALGMPFERVTICMMDPPPAMAGCLQRWVGAVRYCDEMCTGGGG
jgi:hypothetical protein